MKKSTTPASFPGGPRKHFTAKRILRLLVFTGLVLAQVGLHAQGYREDSAFLRNNYTKREVSIAMRDGVKLFTAIYQPKDSAERYPILMVRTPYSVAPYGETQFPYSLGPNPALMREKYIFVYQDVRGRYMSEGDFQEMTPHKTVKKDRTATDESSDAWDTIEWLLKNLGNHNGRVGLWGISYPGFYASASLPDAHPAIRAVSPQAPVTDEFIGDDANHKGAFFLLDNFNFLNYFDAPRNGPVEDYGESVFPSTYRDAYTFFLQMGSVRKANDSMYFGGRGKIWNEYTTHDTYDAYWKARNIRTHLKNIRPAVLVVGGWFDAEDLFGALETYRAIERQSPGNSNRLVMGPWTHGSWSSRNWTQYATHDFSQNTSQYYQQEMETPFFNYYLKDKGSMNLPEATVFETGSNTWKQYAQWPPAGVAMRSLYLLPGGRAGWTASITANAYTQYTSDPSKPVPYTGMIARGRNNEYLAEDQRFAAQRPDVAVFMTDTLQEDLRLSGPVKASLFVSTTGTDADFVVKLIDVLPENTPNPSPNPRQWQMGGMQRLVRAEVFRGKFRNSFEKPEPFLPGKPVKLEIEIPDVAHLFKKGHRVMVQIQSSWFPLVDRNPQTFMRIPEASEKDFRKADIRIYHEPGRASAVILPVMPQ
jgi:putative CocE/NonD family hydrolase